MVTEKDFQECADTLGVEVAALKAVVEVECSSKGGFLVDGRPRILFEGHIFGAGWHCEASTPSHSHHSTPTLSTLVGSATTTEGAQASGSVSIVLRPFVAERP